MNSKLYFPGLNGVRFIAVFIVMVDHLELFKSYFKLRPLWPENFSSHLGSFGVTIFFVLSGYLITYLLIKENKEFGVVEDDKEGKTSLFISMTGTVDDPIIKYDKQGAKQNLKENIVQEKQTLRQILREEFGLFKKDTVVNKKEKPKEEGKFIIKWEDEEKKSKDKKEEDDF